MLSKLLLIGFSALIILFIISSGKLTYISTDYTAGFNQDKFSLIKKGINRQKVLDILGKPFSEADTQLNCDYFSKTKSSLSGFLGWNAVYVCYDSGSNVIDKAEIVFFN